MNVAIIAAGGIGSRTNQSIPKQFIEINGKPLIIYTLEKFQQSKLIDVIAVACLDSWQDKLKEYIKKYNLTKVKYIVKGERIVRDSFIAAYNSLKDICDDNSNIVIHCGNRPNVTEELIANSIKLCEKKGNAIPYIRYPEVTIVTNDHEISKEIANRNKLAGTQEPQTIKKHLLDKMITFANTNNLPDEDSMCAILSKMNEPMYLYEGDIKNFKITYQADIEIFEALLKANK